ncbi:MAG TPA: twin-arginine translocation signal domain-containing protein, partial [Candidatus Polarisedimenticolia bacterium]|nr:twin-arginine translocation signal domain-containing protein [Candidatus Polarisedimenticolia bacterium]
MSGWVGRRGFLKQAGAAALLAAGGPFVLRSRASAQSDRLVVAVGQWGTETPLPWRNTQAEKPLWDHVYDPLIQRDSKTFAYQPGLATEWKPSSEMRTWTFKLRSGVMFHEGFGEMTS